MQNSKKRNTKGQNTLEYMVMVTAVIVAVIYAFINPNGPFRKHYLQTLKIGTDGLLNLGCHLTE